MENEILKWVLTFFLGVLLLLLLMIYRAGVRRMARIYNWNGRRYCYLGYASICRKNGEFIIRLGERMVDLSRTTAYQIRVSKVFYRKNQYRGMLVYVDGGRNYLVIDGTVMRFIQAGL